MSYYRGERTYTVELDPTESPVPHRRVLSDHIDPTEYSREEYDAQLEHRGINSRPWLKYNE